MLSWKLLARNSDLQLVMSQPEVANKFLAMLAVLNLRIANSELPQNAQKNVDFRCESALLALNR